MVGIVCRRRKFSKPILFSEDSNLEYIPLEETTTTLVRKLFIIMLLHTIYLETYCT